jgi:nondiscriminating aspartyl-tRNA synthetase
MERTLIRDAKEKIGELVSLKGFVQTIRNQKAVQFIILRDQTGLIQVVAERSDVNSTSNELISQLTRESVIQVTGTVVNNPSVKLGQLEVQLKTLSVDSMSDALFPIDIFGKTETDVDKRLDWRFLDLRQPENQLIFRIQTTVEIAMREFWISNGFVEIHSPKIMGSPSEGGAELFTLEYFGQTASLAQSPQFYKQMAMAAGMDRVFEIGPAFRADPSFTPRHSTEFTSVDMEMSWIESHHDIMEFEEAWLQHVLTTVKEKHGEEISETFGVEVVIPSRPFPKVTMDEAQKILKEKGYLLPADTKRGDIDPQGERILCEYTKEQYGHEFIFITDYPIEVRPFYHMRKEDEPKETKSFDLLWKWMEITTGAQREHRYDVLVRQATEKGISIESIQFYLDFFKFGCPPHGGFGFGLARLLAAMLNQKNIRDVVFLHRRKTGQRDCFSRPFGSDRGRDKNVCFPIQGYSGICRHAE